MPVVVQPPRWPVQPMRPQFQMMQPQFSMVPPMQSMPKGIKLLDQGVLQGETYGMSTFKLYEACSSTQKGSKPLLLVWLHGLDRGDISPKNILQMHKRIGRRTCFLVPMSPQVSLGGWSFDWGAAYIEDITGNRPSYIYAELHKPYLDDLCGLIAQVRLQQGAEATWLLGYSMGGFGVYQLAAHDPSAFDAVVSVAGYVMGTLEMRTMHKTSQPKASQVFYSFLDSHAGQLAKVRVLLAVHSETDTESSYNDTKVVIDRVREHGGNAQLVRVPNEMADSDPGKKSKGGHRYFNYVLMNCSSQEVVYERLEAALASTEGAAEDPQYVRSLLDEPAVVPAMEGPPVPRPRSCIEYRKRVAAAKSKDM